MTLYREYHEYAECHEYAEYHEYAAEYYECAENHEYAEYPGRTLRARRMMPRPPACSGVHAYTRI